MDKRQVSLHGSNRLGLIASQIYVSSIFSGFGDASPQWCLEAIRVTSGGAGGHVVWRSNSGPHEYQTCVPALSDAPPAPSELFIVSPGKPWISARHL